MPADAATRLLTQLYDRIVADYDEFDATMEQIYMETYTDLWSELARHYEEAG